ncbi:MAG: TldD/PmbA family protein [Candidatus Delongbacteria bacterium]|nr:TldD/PmbA family protein [Candidatus Delongbacteria bacterium]MBN2834909.1 TldD/PmbA family protein [Candidatus Delongbacteria bacterium]
MDYLEIAMDEAIRIGADYADIRIMETFTEFLFLQDLSLKVNSANKRYGYGIRVLKNGAWGFAHNNSFTKDAISETVKKAYSSAVFFSKFNKTRKIELVHERSYIDEFKSPVKIDPFTLQLSEKLDLMTEVNRKMLNHNYIKKAEFMLDSRKDNKYFASTLGSRIHSETTYIYPNFTAYAVTDKDSQSRMFCKGGRNAGWEYVLNENLLLQASRIAQEAVVKANADEPGEIKRRDLLIDPMNLSLTMHESVGHPTELDRVMGWEADMAGLSFATPEKLKSFKYGSELVNFFGDNTLPYGLATAGYDDDGVPGQKWHIIKDGILNEYGSTRDTAGLIGLSSSRGCSRATDYYNFPINRIPNLYLEAGKTPLTPEELISSTDDGILIEGRGSFSIDQHRVNFQFGGDMFWEIKNGKRFRPLKNVLYKSSNPEFWGSVDAICDKRYWESFGITNCGKGQPGQTARMTHGAALTRFKNIRVGG